MKLTPIEIGQPIGTACQNQSVRVVKRKYRIDVQAFCLAINAKATRIIESNLIMRIANPHLPGAFNKRDGRFDGQSRSFYLFPFSGVTPQAMSFKTSEQRSLCVLSEAPVFHLSCGFRDWDARRRG